MADRTVRVTLMAQVAGYVSQMRAAEAATSSASKATVDAKAKFEATNAAMTKIGTVFLAGGALAAAGLALVIKASTEYGAKMAQLQALSHASTDQMKALSDAAMTQGQAFGFTASQVADAEIELTKAGVSVKDQLGGALKGALELAAAGQIDVGKATEYATVAMTQFGLSAGDVPHLADLMAAGADKALGSVGDLGEALKNGGLQAHNMGLSIDDTIGLLSAFANAGIIGAEAGTQMRSMFIQLQRPSSQAKKVLDEYGISLSDASGKFVGITALAGELHDKLGGLTQAQRNAALATIFGSHAITGATVLYQDGAKVIGGWIKGINDTGFASAQAAGKLNSLQGDMQKLAAAFQTDLIKAGADAQGSLRGVTQAATGLLGFLGDLPAPVKDVGMSITELVAGVGLLGGAALIAVPKILALRTAMNDAHISARGLGGAVGKGSAVVVGLLALGGALGALGEHGTANTQQIEQAGIAIQNGWKGADKIFHGAALESGGLKIALDDLGTNGRAAVAKVIDGITALGGLNPFPAHLADVFKSNEQTLDAWGKQLAGLSSRSYPQAARSFAGLVKQYKLGSDQTRTLLDNMPAYKEALVALAGKAHVSATEQNLLNIAMGKGSVGAKVAAQAQRDAASAAAKNASQLAKLTGSGNDATQSMKDLYDALNNLGSTELDARSAARKFQQAIDDATKAVHDNGKGLDINTQKGRDNQAALDDIAQSASQAAAAYVKNGGSAAGAAKIIADGRSAYIRTAEAMGLSKAQANRLADALHLIPKSVTTAANITGASAVLDRIAQIKRSMNNLDGYRADIYINAVMTGVDSSRASQIARNAGFAAGGAVGGRGAKGVDSVPALLAPGEHVFTSSEVDRAGGQAAMYRLRSAIRSGRIPRYASGGDVRSYSGAGGNYGGGAMAFPTHVTLLDENGGLITTARVVANQQIARNTRAQKLTIPR